MNDIKKKSLKAFLRLGYAMDISNFDNKLLEEIEQKISETKQIGSLSFARDKGFKINIISPNMV